MVISYSQVCCKVIGYQYGTPDAVSNRSDLNNDSINSYYVDGVSITHGSPRQHIWTLMCGLYDVSVDNRYNCPCTNGNQSSTIPSFITSVSLVILSKYQLQLHGNHYIQQIHYGMVKAVVLLSKLVVHLSLVYHGLTRLLALLLLITLS